MALLLTLDKLHPQGNPSIMWPTEHGVPLLEITNPLINFFKSPNINVQKMRWEKGHNRKEKKIKQMATSSNNFFLLLHTQDCLSH